MQRKSQRVLFERTLKQEILNKVETMPEPRGRTFVSYAYGDNQDVRRLERLTLKAVKLELFEPIVVPPSEMVSEKLISAIRTCDSFIYIDTPRSRESPWVTLESDYARRNGKPVFRFDPESRSIEKDDMGPLDLPVFASFTGEDRIRVEELVHFMKDERSFDIFMDVYLRPGDWGMEAVMREMDNRLERGGYMVAFLSMDYTNNKAIGFQHELGVALRNFSDQVLVALLEDTVLPDALIDRQAIPLYRVGSSELDRRCVDNLIVRIYWLMQQHHAKKT